jgi:hypothetical protein
MSEAVLFEQAMQLPARRREKFAERLMARGRAEENVAILESRRADFCKKPSRAVSKDEMMGKIRKLTSV